MNSWAWKWQAHPHEDREDSLFCLSLLGIDYSVLPSGSDDLDVVEEPRRRGR